MLRLFLIVAFCYIQAFAQCRNNLIAGELSWYNGTNTKVLVATGGGINNPGVHLNGDSLTIKHNDGAYLANVCVDSWNPTMFAPFYLLDSTLSFTVDLSTVGCGCNAAFYLVSMPAYNEQNQLDPTKCGNYYCDANKVCGLYCPEMDIMEANNAGIQVTPHKCSAPQGKYYPTCDGIGCGQNAIRQNPSSYGFGTNYQINTQKPFQLSVTFKTSNGQLSSMTTVISQSGKTVTLTHDEAKCGSGYLEALTPALQAGMTLVFSHWGSDANTMSWLDIPPCSHSQNCNTNGIVTFSDIRVVHN